MKQILIYTITFTLAWSTENIFISCEGNFYEGNSGSLWMIVEDEIMEYSDNPIGHVAQSLLVHDNQLFVTVNGSGNIQIYDITETGLSFNLQIETNNSGPREMIVIDQYLYFTNWYSTDVKKLDLNTLEIEAEIGTPGLPEDIVFMDGLLFVSIIMNNDWSDGNLVIAIDPNSETIIDYYDVGLGSGNLLVHNNEIYVSRTYYDTDWNAYYGTSKINSDGDIIIANYGMGAACGGGIYSLQNSVYRIYDGGIAQLDDALQIIPETRLGAYNAGEVYSAEVIDNHIYFGLSDFIGSDEVAVINLDGNEIARYDVGTMPGDFAVWSHCLANGDINADSVTNILDIVQIVDLITTSSDYNCHADLNTDSTINILDIIIIINAILN